MKTAKKIYLLAGAFTVLSLMGCSKWLDVKPSDRIIEDQAFSSISGFYSALNGVYIDLLKPELYGRAMTTEFIEILAQRYNVKPVNLMFTSMANYAYTADTVKSKLQNTWNATYTVILSCNKILENAEKKKTMLTGKNYELVTGEVLAMRAFLHFDMLRLFGPIYSASPTNKSIPYSEKVSLSAFELLPADVVVKEKILRDLDQAEALLLKADPVISNGPQSSTIAGVSNDDRFRTLRMNYYAVLALKARVYLYAGDKINALKYAKMVIDDPNRATYFPFVESARIAGTEVNPDRSMSTEVLFGLLNTRRSNLFTGFFNPDGAADNILIPRVGEVDALFLGDERDYRYNPIWKNSGNVANEKYSAKFKKGDSTNMLLNNIMPLIRLGEVYLIAAESELNETNAYGYLNAVRRSRGLTDVSDALAARIQKEYVKEFLSEGQLFFFYKRKALTPLKSGITGNNITMNVAKYVPLLPDSEIQFRN